jgi:integrase
VAGELTGGLARRRETIDRTRALTVAQVAALLTRPELALRERTLWRLLYETAARANELLGLDVEGLDLANRRARVRSTGVRTGSLILAPFE